MASPRNSTLSDAMLPQFYEFGPFRVDVGERLLFRNETLVSLPLKVFETLLFLVQQHGHIVDKSVLASRIWPDIHVGPRSLAQNIFLLRKVLGKKHSEFIETVPRRGYRFVAAIRHTAKTTADRSDRIDLFLAPRPPARVLAVLQLAVLPFRFLGPEAAKEEEYLGIGLADALITKFSNVGELIVRPTSSILKYVVTRHSLLEIGRELGVDSILEGKLQKCGSQVRVTLQLVNAFNGAALWADQFDCKLADIFALQDAISARVVQSLTLKLTAEDKHWLAARQTENAEAYKEYMKGRFHWNKRTAQELLKAIECFECSLRKDSLYALAYTGLADCYNLLSFYGAFAPKEVLPKAVWAATKALEINPQLVEAVTSLAFATLAFEWNWTRAEHWFKRALELNPDYSTAHQWYAECHLALGCLDEAVAAITRAQDLEPLSVNINRHVGWMLCYARKYDSAIEQIQSTLELDSSNALLYHDLGLVYIHTNRPEESIAALKRANALSPDDPDTTAFLAYAYAVAGHYKKEARQVLEQLKEMSTRKFVSSYLLVHCLPCWAARKQAVLRCADLKA